MEKHYLRCGVKMVSTPAPLQSLGYDGSAKTLARTYMYVHTYVQPWRFYFMFKLYIIPEIFMTVLLIVNV